MQNKIESPQKVDYSSVTVVYMTPENTWRGFVVPYDISHEGDSRNEVEAILKEKTESYLEALEAYNNPAHLTYVTLSEESDIQKWSNVAFEVAQKMKNNISKFEGLDYYAEAQLPA